MQDFEVEIEKFEKLAIAARKRKSYRINLIQTYLEKLKRKLKKQRK